MIAVEVSFGETIRGCKCYGSAFFDLDPETLAVTDVRSRILSFGRVNASLRNYAVCKLLLTLRREIRLVLGGFGSPQQVIDDVCEQVESEFRDYANNGVAGIGVRRKRFNKRVRFWRNDVLRDYASEFADGLC
jgi:hypothetical protein